jgi:hypothetical protein
MCSVGGTHHKAAATETNRMRRTHHSMSSLEVAALFPRAPDTVVADAVSSSCCCCCDGGGLLGGGGLVHVYCLQLLSALLLSYIFLGELHEHLRGV